MLDELQPVVDPHAGEHDGERVARVLLQLRPLVPVLHVLDRQGMKREDPLQDLRGLTAEQQQETSLWAARALIRATLDERDG